MKTKEELYSNMAEEMPFSLDHYVKPYILEAMEVYKNGFFDDKVGEIIVVIDKMLADISEEIKTYKFRKDQVSYGHLKGQEIAFKLVSQRLKQVLNENIPNPNIRKTIGGGGNIDITVTPD